MSDLERISDQIWTHVRACSLIQLESRNLGLAPRKDLPQKITEGKSGVGIKSGKKHLKNCVRDFTHKFGVFTDVSYSNTYYFLFVLLF